MKSARVKKHSLLFMGMIIVVTVFLFGAVGSIFTGPHDDTVKEDLLQFTAGGHVMGFDSGGVYIVGLDHALRVEFAGGTPVLPQAESSGTAESGIPQLGRAIYSGVWEKIDVIYSAASGGIAESTYIIHPGGDPEAIRLSYNVPVAVLPGGGLRSSFERGYITESAPVAWQEIEGRRIVVEVEFELQAEQLVGFALGDYNPYYALYIDPVYEWHTFYGSTGLDYGHAIVVGYKGDIYITGASSVSWDGPGTPPEGAPKNPHTGGSDDIVVVKLDPSGGYLWHTFYGGIGSDDGLGIAIDADESLYISGFSMNPWNGPEVGDTPVNHFSSGKNIFILKLDQDGEYEWHTFHGSSSSGQGIAVHDDKDGRFVYVAGQCYNSWDGPGDTPTSPVNPHSLGLGYDISVLKLDQSGKYMRHTFYGANDVHDYGYGIALDSYANVYVTGYSAAGWLGPGDARPLEEHTGNTDIVVLKLDDDLEYDWHTFYGSDQADEGKAITTDSEFLYITGYSKSSWQGPAPEEAEPDNPYVQSEDIVIIKMDMDGNYIWHTFHGGSGADEGYAIAHDAGQRIYIVGTSQNWNGPGGQPPDNPHAGVFDIFLLKLDESGKYMGHTFYGCSGNDSGKGLAVVPPGKVYIVGHSFNTWKFGSADPFNPFSGSGAWDIATIYMEVQKPPVPTLTAPANGSNVPDTTVNFTWNAADHADRYQLQVSTTNTFSHTYINEDNLTHESFSRSGFPADGTTYYWRVRAANDTVWGNWSAVWSFVNGTAGPPPSTGPTLRFPLHGANVPYDNIRLVWFKDAVATKYQYQVFKADWSLHASGTLGDLDNVLVDGFPGDGSLYRWRVRAGNASGWGPFSSLRAFFSLNAPPAQVVQHSPAHGAAVPGSDIEFKWIKAHYATKYQYQVFNLDWTVYEAGTLGNFDSVTVSGFPNDGSIYRWRVRAGNPYGWGAWSDLRVLTNDEVPVPPQVLLHSPGHGATVPGSSLQLQWHFAAGATNYQYQVFNPDWSVHASGTLGNVNSVTVSGLPNDGTLYRWRVRAGNASGWGQFSSLRAFWNGPGSYEESE